MSLVVDGVTKRFARFPALKGVSLTVEPGEFVALLGPSGSGKTTLLRVVAGLETPDAGRVVFDGEDFLALSARQRRIGMVFQHYALFRHMSVARNISFGLRALPARDRPRRADIDASVTRLLSLIQLEGFGERFPAQLSGGQQQRVALARALAIGPRMLLLDEPFGALDAKVRKDLRHWLRRVHDETGITTIFVTHDQEEAMGLADRVAVMREGRIEQVGAPAELEAAPVSAFVFDFLGDSNRLDCRIEGDRAYFDGFDAPATIQPGGAGRGVAWFRPHETTLEPSGAGVPVTVSNIVPKGATTRFECRTVSGQIFEAEYARDTWSEGLSVGTEGRLRPKRVFVFPDAGRADQTGA
jgi:sulfate transport system ATP-binding protein